MRLGALRCPEMLMKPIGADQWEENKLSCNMTNHTAAIAMPRTMAWRLDAKRLILGQTGAMRFAARLPSFSRAIGSMPARLDRPFHPILELIGLAIAFGSVGRSVRRRREMARCSCGNNAVVAFETRRGEKRKRETGNTRCA